jgi:hypothetical protein
MTEAGAGTPQDDAATAPAKADAPKRRPRARRSRGIVAWVLVVLASLLIPISVLSTWAITTVTNTDQYVSTMAPLARNPVVVNHLATKATDALFSTKAVQNEITDALPAKAKPIVQPITNQLKTYVHGVALKVFESPQFGRLFDALNRRTHSTVVDILTGKQNNLTKAGQVALNLSPSLNQLIDNLNSRGVTLFNPLKPILSQSNGVGLTVVSKSQVSKFSALFNTIVTLGWAVPVISLVLGILGIVIAVDRRKTLQRMAVGVGIFTLVLLGALAFGRSTFVGAASSHHLDTGVAAAVWDTVLRFLKQDLRWTLLAAFLVALGAWVAGPARYAVWIRTKAAVAGRWVFHEAQGLTSGAREGLANSSGARKAGGWIGEHIKGLRILGLVVGGLIVLLGGNVTGWDLLILIIVLAVYLGLLQLVVIWARRVTADTGEPVAVGSRTDA